MMIRPTAFGYNAQTAGTNAFQKSDERILAKEIHRKALQEFEKAVAALTTKGIHVITFNERENIRTPDAIFPNNWISFHEDGTVVLYPMFAHNRRLERRKDIIETLKKKFDISKITDLSSHENKGLFLEGTGSLVMDHDKKIAYACLSPRTHKTMLTHFEKKLGYKTIYFSASDKKRIPIYHTNVLMMIGKNFSVICAEAIKNQKERKKVIQSLEKTGHEIVFITHEQMEHFAGNMLALKNKKGKHFVAMSRQAFESLFPHQIAILKRHAEIITSPIETIEMYGGGSMRCMIAEIFLPKKKKDNPAKHL